ncbi:MAG: cell wall hydrolase [Bacilli bacterium]
MAIVNYTTKEKELLARIMRAEALGDGNLAMLMVGNVIINRTIANCLTFTNLRTITDVVYQKNQFSGINSSLFVGNPTTKELELAERILRGEYYHPATNALWFFNPGTNNPCPTLWYDQRNSGKYKSHCFYIPYPGVCRQLH